MRLLAILPLACVPTLARAQTQVHVVELGGGGDFGSISAAITAAASGDILLLKGGDYLAAGQGVFLTSDKSLAVVAESGASVESMHLDVENLDAGFHLLVQGLELVTLGGFADSVRNSAGPVWLERCRFEHRVGGTASRGGFQAEGSGSVVFTRTELGAPVQLLSDDGIALSVFASRVHLLGSSVVGLDDNVAALSALQGSFVEVLGSSVRGGAGADGGLGHCNGHDGGTGLLLRTGSAAVTLDATIAGGAGGAAQAGTSCLPGDDGRATLVLGGSRLDARAGAAKELELSSPVRDDELVQVTVRGQPGDRAWIVLAGQPMPGQASSVHEGELLVGAPRQTVALGTIPSGGTLSLQFPAPTLPAGTEGATFFCQALVKDLATGRFVLSNPAALVVVDDSF